MNISDPISDMLTRLRNANMTGLPEIKMPHSQLRSDIARVLKKEGYIEDFKLQKDGKKTNLQITLRGQRKTGAVVGLKKVSTPGRRRYVGVRDIPRVLGGMGICILSTSSGVMTGHEARKKNVGGEILCEVW
jgi:small subunit ribosomal protein S8